MAVDGLKVVFDPALDLGAWPGLLDGRSAVAGESWLGPLGLLARLETELGLLARHVTSTERAALVAGTLAGADGFWRASFDADPLATARRLLADRDALAMWRWRGEPASERLAQLWAATAAAPAGVPDRLARVLEALSRRSVDMSTIAMYEPVDAFAPMWREVLVALAEKGVRLEPRVLSEVRGSGDIEAARGAAFTPSGDGSLRIIRPQAPLAAAEEVAAALAACTLLDGVVVIGPDAILDGALVRHGLPRLGVGRGITSSAALVRLVIATAFHPMDPSDLHALLCADPGPVPRRVASRLVRAISSYPARGSHAWNAALVEGLQRLEEERRGEVAARIAALIDPVVGRDAALSLGQLATRMKALATWAHGRATTVASVRGAAILADRLVSLARLTGHAQFDRSSLRRLLDELEPPEFAGAPAEVGLTGVAVPGAMLGPARVVIWWDFTRESSPRAARVRLSKAERAGLESVGIMAPDPGWAMSGEARRWRRPLRLASEALVLVCPRTDEAGERAHPHPLWDEVTANVSSGADTHLLEAARVTVPAIARRMKATLRPTLEPADSARTPTALELGDPESPSSLEELLACSLAWALRKKGRLYGGVSAGPGKPGPLVYGNLAHHVLAQVFGSKVASPDEAAQRAEKLFDETLAGLAESLLLPDFQAERAELRHGLVESAREVGRLLERSGAAVRGLELSITGQMGPVNVAGRADLLLASPDAVIDYKWGASTYRELLRQGTAFQLVAYAALVKSGGNLPDVAYLSLKNQRLLAASGSSALPDATRPGTHTAKEMLDGALVRLEQRRSELAKGHLEAPSAVEDFEDHGLSSGVMRLAPKCQYCELGSLCGRRTRP